MDMKEYLEVQLDMCRRTNADTATVRFEKEEWMIEIKVKRKKGNVV